MSDLTSRQLDAEVAETLFDLLLTESCQPVSYFSAEEWKEHCATKPPPAFIVDDRGCAIWSIDDHKYIITHKRVPRFSEDWNCMRRVVERTEKLGYELHVHDGSAHFVKDGKEAGRSSFGSVSDLPRAVSLAAVEAVKGNRHEL